jgi:hypothetical protein
LHDCADAASLSIGGGNNSAVGGDCEVRHECTPERLQLRVSGDADDDELDGDEVVVLLLLVESWPSDAVVVEDGEALMNDVGGTSRERECGKAVLVLMDRVSNGCVASSVSSH